MTDRLSNVIGSARRLHLRLLATLLAVFAVNLVVLASVAWAVHALLAVSGTDLSAPIPLVVGLVVFAALTLVAVEAHYGYRHTLRAVDSEPVEGDGPRNVAGRVRRLAFVPVGPSGGTGSRSGRCGTPGRSASSYRHVTRTVSPNSLFSL